MAKSFDFIVDEDGDLAIEDGDFVVDESDTQHIEDILFAAPGEFKQTPILGFDINRFKNAPRSTMNKFKRDLKVQLEDVDIYKNVNIAIDNSFQNVKILFDLK